MTPKRRGRRRKPRCWSYTAGRAPLSVQVHERTPGGLIYVRIFDPSIIRHRGDSKLIRGAQVRRSLGIRDKEAAIRHAEEEARKLRAGSEAMAGRPTLAGVLQLYLLHRTPRKESLDSRKEDKRRSEMWTRLYCTRLVGELTETEWNEFTALRSRGAIDARGRMVPEADRVPVGPRTADADLVFLNAVLNWALGFKTKGRPLIDANPFGAPAPGVKRRVERPVNLAPLRPIATYDRFLVVRAAAEQVRMEARKGEAGAELVTVGRAQFKHGEGPVKLWMKRSYLPELLDFVESTGRRIGAIARLRYSDFIRESGQVTKIRWRPFKREKEKTVVLPDRARAAVERILRERPGMGDVYVFPSPGDPSKPITRQLARKWLMKAERVAGLDHLKGGSFHPYRRKWATERKHHPTVDVMAAGGWTDDRSLKQSYIAEDEETVIAVVNEPRKLLERKGS